MPTFTSRTLFLLRRFLRASGLTGPLSTLLGRGGYERQFNSSLAAAVQRGDCIWDVGANIGHYTVQLAELVGLAGKVFAFEPSPINAARLREATVGLANVTAVELALSDSDGSGSLYQGEDELGATSRMVRSESLSDRIFVVRVVTGDEVIAQGCAEAPNVLKIDVEGHELQVLRGLCNQLRHNELRHIFVEVHFRILDESGRSDVPGEIVTVLESTGFDLKWVDPSHLYAYKASNNAKNKM